MPIGARVYRSIGARVYRWLTPAEEQPADTQLVHLHAHQPCNQRLHAVESQQHGHSTGKLQAHARHIDQQHIAHLAPCPKHCTERCVAGVERD